MSKLGGANVIRRNGYTYFGGALLKMESESKHWLYPTTSTKCRNFALADPDCEM